MAPTADQALARATKLYDQLCTRRAEVKKADDYFRGKQPLKFASDKWREYHAGRYEGFCDNWCAPVGNTPKERLRVDGFRLDNDPQISDDEKNLWRDWQANDMEAQSSQGFLSSIISSRSAVLVWGDRDENPVVTWERPDQVIVDYDPERPFRRSAAVKCWSDGTTEFLTLYDDEYVWKWQRPYTTTVDRYSGKKIDVPAGSRGVGFNEGLNATPAGLYVWGSGVAQWRPREVAGEVWPLPNPLGEVPVVEFPNRPTLGGEPLSDIAGTMAMQDAINLLWAYLFNAADFASFPARVVMGQEPPKIPILDESGQKVGEREVDLKKLSEDRILWLTGQNAKIGEWTPAKLDVFTTVIEIAVTHVAAQTRTPPHYLVLGKGLVNVNAEGMKTAETGLVMKVREEQVFFSPSVRTVFRLKALVRNQSKLADQCRFGVVQWKDAENHSEAQMVDALLKLQQIGLPFEWLIERYGLSQTEVQRVLAMREREQAHDLEQYKLATAAQIAAGGTGGPAVPGAAAVPAAA